MSAPALKSARHQLAAQLKPLLPKRWRIVPYQKNLERLSVPIVMLKLSHIEKLPAAPRSHVKTTWTVTVVDPNSENVEVAEDALDEEVTILCLAINAIAGVTWKGADKVLFQDKYLAFDVTVEMNANPTKQKD